MSEKQKKKKTVTMSARMMSVVLASAMTFGGMGTLAAQEIVDDVLQPMQATMPDTDIKDYTMMMYIVGSDLESSTEDDIFAEGGSASKDMAEIVQAMSEYDLDSTVNVVAQIGGTTSWEDESLSGVQNARVQIDSSGIGVREKLPDTNMGNSKTLTKFIDYAYQNYPAKNYIMVFWNHGNGPADGYGYDTMHDGDTLTLRELNTAFQNAQMNNFAFIGFDACCMGNIETVNALYSYADYIIASPACEAVDGWDYDWMEAFSLENSTSETLACHIVETFDEFYNMQEHKGIDATLSCYDTEKYKELSSLLKTYNSELFGRQGEQMYGKINTARNSIAGYYSGGEPGEMLELLDLRQFYNSMDLRKWEKEELDSLIDEFVCVTNVDREYLCGISIYLPNKMDCSLAEHMLNYLNCLYDENYLQFVYRYAVLLDQDLEMDMSSLSTSFDEKSMEISFQVDAEMQEQTSIVYIVTAMQMEEDGPYCLLSTDSDLYFKDESTLTGIVDIKYFSIAGEVLCLIERCSSDERTEYVSPVYYKGRLCMMTIEVSKEYVNGRIVNIIPYSPDGQASKEQYVLEEGAAFAAVYPILNGKEENIFNMDISTGNCYIGEEVRLQGHELELELQDVEFSNCVFGLMIRDKSLAIHFSGLNIS